MNIIGILLAFKARHKSIVEMQLTLAGKSTFCSSYFILLMPAQIIATSNLSGICVRSILVERSVFKSLEGGDRDDVKI